MIGQQAFDALASSNKGIGKLRELILDLAVRGLLVSQDPNDEPASVLLEKIAAERKGLIKEGKIKNQIPVTGISNAKKPFVIPVGWQWTTLSDTLALVTDGDHQPPPKADVGIPFLVIGNLNKARVNLDGCRYVPDTYYQSLDWGKQPSLGDILYTVTGSYGIAIKVETDDLFCVQRHVAIFKTTNSSPSKYLFSLLGSHYAFAYATQIATGIAQKTVPLIGLRKMPIPLPPENEQIRIGKKLDELMSLCDQLDQRQNHSNTVHQQILQTLLESLTQAVDNDAFQKIWTQIAEHFDTLFTTEASVDQLKQVILQLAVMGKLVAQDSNDEPAGNLLNRINKELCSIIDEPKLPKLQRDDSIGNPEDFHTVIPNNWIWCELQDISIFKNGKAHEQFISTQPGYILVNSKFVSNSGEKFKYTSEMLSPLSSGEIAIVMSDVPSGRALARCFIVDKDNTYSLNQRIGGLKTSSNMSVKYLSMVLNRNKYYLQYDDGKKQSNLKKIQILSCPVPLPPLAEQHRIVAKVDDFMTICDLLKAKISNTQVTQANLATAIVEKAAA